MTTADLAGSVRDDGLMGPGPDRPKRRSFSAEHERAIVAEYDALSEPGANGVLLWSGELISSHLNERRRAREAGTLAGLADKPRPPARTGTAGDRPARRRQRAAAGRAGQDQGGIGGCGKAHALLELLSESADTDGRSAR
jgi:transposase